MGPTPRVSARTMSLTARHLGLVAREIPDPGPSAAFTRLTDADFAAQADRLLADLAGGSLWIFAYGSLIWNPGFDHVEERRATVHGWHRAFCIHITYWRATPEGPGLMLALQRGGSCVGVAYRLPGDALRERMLRLLRREISVHEDLPWLRWVRVRTPDGPLRALTFYCAPRDDPYALNLSFDAQAARLATAVGHKGSGAEYLFNTVSHLEALGIHDPYLWRMQARVAALIDGI